MRKQGDDAASIPNIPGPMRTAGVRLVV